MFKHIAIIIGAFIVFLITHLYGIAAFTKIAPVALIYKQHLFLGIITLFIYVMTYITFKVAPKNTGFVFLGLLLAKMILAGLFVYQVGWLEEGSYLLLKVTFLFFYFLYTTVLVLSTIKILRKI